ncbi:hypothetical protein KY334_07835 [Candidatus Woesearchaeota archaeon]|nr:hypothetical protein [Candidatus Woesearchaeota archaeon]
MKYVLKIMVLVSLLSLLVACGGGGEVSSNWKSGTQGVVVQFAPDSPPNVVYSGEEYVLGLELRNKGSFPLDDEDELDVDLYFSGFERDLISLPYEDYVSIVGGKTPTNLEGGLEFYDKEFDVEIYDDSDSLNQNLKVTACYEYETNAALETCVDPNPIQNDEDTCTPGVTGTGSQGGPIAISSVTQESLKGKARYTIKISNVGGGTVFMDNDCLNPSRTNKNIVYLEDAYLGDQDMHCSPDDYIRLVNGVGTLSCIVDRLDEDEPAYKTSLGVHLSYNYKTSATKQIQIKRIE